jgi:hypothetical protein
MKIATLHPKDDTRNTAQLNIEGIVEDFTKILGLKKNSKHNFQWQFFEHTKSSLFKLQKSDSDFENTFKTVRILVKMGRKSLKYDKIDRTGVNFGSIL